MRAGACGWHTLLFAPPMPCLFALHILFIIAWLMFFYLPHKIVLIQCILKQEYIAAVTKYVNDPDYINYLNKQYKHVVVESYQELVHAGVITEYA